MVFRDFGFFYCLLHGIQGVIYCSVEKIVRECVEHCHILRAITTIIIIIIDKIYQTLFDIGISY